MSCKESDETFLQQPTVWYRTKFRYHKFLKISKNCDFIMQEPNNCSHYTEFDYIVVRKKCLSNIKHSLITINKVLLPVTN